MARVTKALQAKSKHKKVLSRTKGHYGARSRLYKTAKQSNIKSLQYAFRDRKNRKRAFRSLWIARINAGARELGTSYSVLIKRYLSDVSLAIILLFELIETHGLLSVLV